MNEVIIQGSPTEGFIIWNQVFKDCYLKIANVVFKHCRFWNCVWEELDSNTVGVGWIECDGQNFIHGSTPKVKT